MASVGVSQQKKERSEGEIKDRERMERRENDNEQLWRWRDVEQMGFVNASVV